MHQTRRVTGGAARRPIRRTGTYYRRAARRGGGATCAADVATLTDPPNDGLTFATQVGLAAFLLFLVQARIFLGRSANIKLLTMINDGAWSFIQENTDMRKMMY